MSNWRWSTLTRRAIGRCLVVVLTTVMLVAAAPARASEGSPTRHRLTEAQAVQRALENPALADLRAGWTAAAKAEGLARTRWQNPSLSYTREQLLGNDVVGEDYLTLSQAFDISGRKSLARRAAKERERAADHQADAVVVEFKAEVRRRFYRLLRAQEREQALQAWSHRVQARLHAVVKRERAGDAAAYDRVRLQQEVPRPVLDQDVARR